MRSEDRRDKERGTTRLHVPSHYIVLVLGKDNLVSILRVTNAQDSTATLSTLYPLYPETFSSPLA